MAIEVVAQRERQWRIERGVYGHKAQDDDDDDDNNDDSDDDNDNDDDEDDDDDDVGDKDDNDDDDDDDDDDDIHGAKKDVSILCFLPPAGHPNPLCLLLLLLSHELIVIWSWRLCCCLPTDGGQIRVGGIVKIRQIISKKRQKKGVFTTQLKHNHGHLFEGCVIRISLVDPFHSTSALLHLFVRPSCRGAVSHGWMVHVHCVSPALYALRRLQNT